MVHKGKHSHKQYKQIHLTSSEKKSMDKIVQLDPVATPKSATVDVSARTGEVTTPLRDSVAEILNNKDRTKYELKNSRERTGTTKRGDFLGELGKIQEEFDGAFLSCEVLKSKFSIVFSASKKYNLPFLKHPLITDVTYKAVEDGYYLRSSVMFHPPRHIIYLNAIPANTSCYKRLF